MARAGPSKTLKRGRLRRGKVSSGCPINVFRQVMGGCRFPKDNLTPGPRRKENNTGKKKKHTGRKEREFSDRGVCKVLNPFTITRDGKPQKFLQQTVELPRFGGVSDGHTPTGKGDSFTTSSGGEKPYGSDHKERASGAPQVGFLEGRIRERGTGGLVEGGVLEE